MRKSITSSKGVVYYVEKVLGKGQFSKVYYVVDEKQNEYAMKAVNWEKLTMSEKMVQLFKNEQQIMEVVDHPRILKLYDKLIEGSTIFLITTYCEGGNVEDLILNNYPKGLGEKMATSYLIQVAEAFQTMRKYSIIHRDLKPANMFIKKGEIVIGDFGFAKIGVSMTQTKLGTPYYMAPEILDESNKKEYSSKCDLWSIGVCYYFMLYGQMPFAEAKTSKDLLTLARDRSGANLKFGIEPSALVKDLLCRLIEYNPEKRMSFDEFFRHPLIGLEPLLEKDKRAFSAKDFEFNQQQDEESFRANDQSYHAGLLKNRPDPNYFSVSTINSYVTDFDLSHSDIELSQKNSIYGNINESDIPGQLKPYLYNKNIIIFLMDTAKKLKICESQKHLDDMFLHFIVIELIVIKKAINYTQYIKNIMLDKTNVFDITNFKTIVNSNAYNHILSFFVDFEKFVAQVYAKLKGDLSLHTNLAGQTIERIEAFKNEECNKEIQTSISHILNMYTAKQTGLGHIEKNALMQAVIYLFFNNNISAKFPESQFSDTKEWINFCQMLNAKPYQEIEAKMFQFYGIA